VNSNNTCAILPGKWKAHTAALPHGEKKWRGGGNVTNAEGINLQGETSV